MVGGLPGGFCSLGYMWGLATMPGRGGPLDAFLPQVRLLLWLSEGLLEAACVLRKMLLASQLPAYFFLRRRQE